MRFHDGVLIGFLFNIHAALILCFPGIYLLIRRIMGALVNGDPAARLLYDVDPLQLNNDPWQDTLMSVVCHFLDGSPVDLHSASIAMALSITDQAGKNDCGGFPFVYETFSISGLLVLIPNILFSQNKLDRTISRC